MSELTQEQFDGLPEYAKSAFVQDGEKFVPAKDAKLKATLDELDKKYKTEVSDLRGKIDEIQREEQAKIEAAKKEALEKAKSGNDVAEAVKQYEERMADLEKRRNESEAQYKERLDKMANTIKSEKKNSVVSDIVAQIGNKQGAKYLKRIVSDRIDVNPETGAVTFLNEDGSASSLDSAGFITELKKDEHIHPLLSADVVTNGGGLANGAGRGSAPSVTNQQAEEAKKKGDLDGYLKAQLGAKHG